MAYRLDRDFILIIIHARPSRLMMLVNIPTPIRGVRRRHDPPHEPLGSEKLSSQAACPPNDTPARNSGKAGAFLMRNIMLTRHLSYHILVVNENSRRIYFCRSPQI